MTNNKSQKDYSYLIIQRKLFTRLVLTYEIILDSWGCTVNESNLFNSEFIQYFIDSGKFSDDLVILELFQIQEKRAAYSFSSLRRVIFNSESSYQFFRERNYENFDVSSLNCYAFPYQKTNEIGAELVLNYPSNPTNKNDLVFSDGIIALVFNELSFGVIPELNLRKSLTNSNGIESLLFLLFNENEVEDPNDIKVLNTFMALCLENSLDRGWDAEFVLHSLGERISKKISESEKFSVWKDKTNDLLSGRKVTIPLDDNGSVVLRAIMLVLLNPELDNLLTIKNTLANKIGDKVFCMAKKLILLRTGFSFFNFAERLKLGEARTFVRDLNASLYNKEFSDLYPLPEVNEEKTAEIIPNSVPKNEKLALSSVTFLSRLDDKFEGNDVYSIVGIVPNSGFNAHLIEKVSGEVFIWLIDRRVTKNSKYKGKMAIDLLQIQSSLPCELRFEVDDQGVYLRLFEYIKTESELLELLKLVYRELVVIKAFNIRKSILVK